MECCLCQKIRKAYKGMVVLRLIPSCMRWFATKCYEADPSHTNHALPGQKAARHMLAMSRAVRAAETRLTTLLVSKGRPLICTISGPCLLVSFWLVLS